MPNDGLQIRGVVAHIKYGYYVAAALHGYTVTRDKTTKTWSLSGTVVTSDAFRLAQHPLEFVAPHKGGGWRWPIETFVINHGTVHATLSAPQELT